MQFSSSQYRIIRSHLVKSEIFKRIIAVKYTISFRQGELRTLLDQSCNTSNKGLCSENGWSYNNIAKLLLLSRLKYQGILINGQLFYVK